MTPERKAQINRRLAEFDEVDPRVVTYAQEHPTVSDSVMPDYTADLNALARLERKLPPHRWQVYYDKGIQVSLHELDPILGRVLADCTGPMQFDTEAEARAEAICQYLEATKT